MTYIEVSQRTADWFEARVGKITASRARSAMDFLKSVGFTRVQNLRGGILDWIDKVDPSQPKY